MMDFIIYLILIFTLVSAFYAAFTSNLINSLLALSILSSNLVMLFVILQAPDVALTEIVIASGVTTGFFIITIDKTGGKR